MATVWHRRHHRCCPVFHLSWLILLIARACCAAMSVQTTSSVLEEVLEHGPLFDEIEDEAWWSGVDVVDTALRSWPEPAPISDPSGLLAVSTSALLMKEEEDFCRFWQSHGRVESSGSSSPLLPADACSLMNRALTVDLSGGYSSMLLLPRLPPPPPVPPTLTDLVKQLNQLSQLQQEQQQQPPNIGNNDSECLLCQWATLNGTIDLLPNSGKAPVHHHYIPYSTTVISCCTLLSIILRMKCVNLLPHDKS